MKPSELFEGKNSSLKSSFDAMPQETKECCLKCKNPELTGHDICAFRHYPCHPDGLVTPKEDRKEERDYEAEKQEIIKLMDMVTEDVENDAKDFDGKPFTGKTMAEYMGNHSAAIVAIAKAVKEILLTNASA